MRDIVQLQCSKCNQRNYSTTRNRKVKKEKLQLRKYCPRCRTHTLHKESK